MLNPTPDMRIEKLQHQLTEVKVVYENKIRMGSDYSSLSPLERHIRELERAVREFLYNQ